MPIFNGNSELNNAYQGSNLLSKIYRGAQVLWEQFVFDPKQNFETVTYTGNGSTQKITGYIRKGAAFNGSSSQISTNGEPIPATSNFTISFWINRTSSNNADLFNQATSSGDNRTYFKLDSNGTFRVYSAGTRGARIQVPNTASSITNGQWEHIAIVRDGSNMTFYINGTGETETISGGTVGVGRGDMVIGSPSASPDATIDQVRIFDKALSSSEVTTLYNEDYDSSTKSTTDILGDGSGVALYELDEDANDTGLPLANYTPIANRTFESSKSTSAESTAPRDIEFSSDGTKLFFCEGSNNRIHQYTMTTAWDVSTASHNGYYDVTSQISGGSFPISVQFKSDGTKMYVSTYDTSPERIYEYDLSSAWVVTSGVSYNSKFGNVTVQAWGMEFNSAGTILICSSDTASGNLCKYTLSTAWDISTISLSQQVTLTSIKGIDLSPDGKQLLGAYFPSSGNKTIKSYSLSTAYDITTLTQREEWDVNSIENVLQTVTCKFDGSNKIDKLYFVGFQQDTIYGYDIDETADFIVGYNGTPTNINFLGMAFQPDLVWIKNRDANSDPIIQDTVRGITKMLETDGTAAESNNSVFGHVDSVESNGFTVDSGGSTEENANKTGRDYVAWCWKAADTTTTISAGTVGNTIASDVRANTDAGFSIVKYTAANSTQTAGHGLSSTPELVITKRTSSPAYDWIVYTNVIDTSVDYLILNSNVGKQDTTKTLNSTVFTTPSTGDFIAYCFHSVDGYQKVGSYTGNGGAKSITGLGFTPRFVLFKCSTTTGAWIILDSTRGSSVYLLADDSAAEASTWFNFTFDSDGWSVNTNNNNVNGSSQTYIYLAIA